MELFIRLASSLLSAVQTVSAQTGRYIPPTIRDEEAMPSYYACDAGMIPGPRVLGGIRVDEASLGYCVMLCPRGTAGPEPKYLIPNAEHAVRFAALFVSYLERNASVSHNPVLWYRGIQYTIRHMERNFPGFTVEGVKGSGALVRSAELATKARD